MFVRESGARGASAILMLHGQGLDGSVFDGLASRLWARFHVLVPDMPGYGRSQPIEPYTTGAIRAALERELEARGVASTSIVGFSIGTYHTLAFALAGRIRVERLVLLGVLAGASAEVKAAFAGLRLP